MDKEIKNIDLSDIKKTAYLYIKAEKLSYVIYKISDFITDTEPLKTKLRDASLSLLSDMSRLNKTTFISKSNIILSVLSNVRSLRSFLSLGVAGGLVSEMNASLLRREFELLENELISFSGLSEDMSVYMHVLLPETPSRLSKSSEKSTSFEAATRHGAGARKLNQDRRREIVEFLTRNGSSSIKEVLGAVSNCSEKTLQRELASLVSEGQVSRIGERRWSKYSLLGDGVRPVVDQRVRQV